MKIGDIVRPTAESPWGDQSPRSSWDYPSRVTSVCTGSERIVTVEVLEGPFTGKTGGFHISYLQIVDDNKSRTDQELANEYRRLRGLAHSIARELSNRGYHFEFFSKLTGEWQQGSVLESPKEFAFTKQISDVVRL